jgi:DNA-binding response OmpR family regulator
MPKILVIEDDVEHRALIRERFRDAYEIIESGDAASALALALEHRPDCVLLDLGLPEYSGFEVCQTLTSLSTTRLIPILVITARPAEEYQEFCLNLGAADYFQKPLDFVRLRACVDSILEHGPKERRNEPRIRMQVTLRLSGQDAEQKDFSVLTATEDVSRNGFLASCGAPLKQGSVVEVYLKGKGERFVGLARLVHAEWEGMPWAKHGFQFLEGPDHWVLQ